MTALYARAVKDLRPLAPRAAELKRGGPLSPGKQEISDGA